MLMNTLQHLTDDELLERIAALDGREREATAALVAHLAELEARDLHLAMGFRSLYRYWRAVLHLSEYESYNRMEAAHAARRFPVIVPMVAEGLLHLTAVRLLAPRLGDENHLALLGGAIHKSKVEVQDLLAAWFPKPAVRTSIRRAAARVAASADRTAPSAASSPASAAASAAPTRAAFTGGTPNPQLQPPVSVGADAPGYVEAPVGTGATAGAAPSEPAIPSRAPQRPKASIDPLSAETYAVRLTARRATIERLRRAQDLLSHAVPDGDVDEILYRALGELIQREERARAITRKPAARRQTPPPPAKPESRHVAAAVEREVRARDDGRCAFVSRDGRRCQERRFLELHHVKPWIAGGPSTAANIALRCRAHNAYEWKVYVAPINASRDAATRSGTS